MGNCENLLLNPCSAMASCRLAQIANFTKFNAYMTRIEDVGGITSSPLLYIERDEQGGLLRESRVRRDITLTSKPLTGEKRPTRQRVKQANSRTSINTAEVNSRMVFRLGMEQ